MKRNCLIIGLNLLLIISIPFGYSQEVKKLSLDDCIEIALKNNTDIISAKSNAKSASADLQYAIGNFTPSLDASAGWTRNSEAWTTIRFDELVSSKESYYYEVSISQPIFTFFKNYFSLKSAKMGKKYYKKQMSWTKQIVVLDVKLKYYNVLKQKQLLKVAEETLKTSEEELNRITEMENIGAASRAEVFQQKVRVGENKLVLVEAKNAFTNAKTALNYTLGIDVMTEIEFVSQAEDLSVKALDIDFDKAVNQALNNRLDYQSTQDMLKSAHANVSYQKTQYLPDISFYGRYRWWDVQFPKNQRDLEEFDSYSFGFNLGFNYVNPVKTDANVQKAKARVVSAEADLEQAERQVALDVKTAMLEIEKSIENLEVTEEIVNSAEEDYRLASERYRIGAGTLIEQLVAQNSLTKARVNRIQAIYDYKYAMTALDLAMGQLTW